MSLPELQLDDRDFQSLVDEARSRIAHTCPAWNEHNVSDPGITLIELFAWMTDLLIYRVNRIPEKVQIALLDLVGVKLSPAKVARTELRFRLSAPASARVVVETGGAEVGTAHQPPAGPVVFRNVEPIVVPPLRLDALKLMREGVTSNVSVEDGVAKPSGSERPGLASPSRPDDGLYLGFHDSLASLLVAVTIEATPAHGTGIAPATPPWWWEVARGDGTWHPATVLSDTTGGLNYASGTIELQLPHTDGPETVGGRQLQWLRCRLPERGADTDTGGYTHAPKIERVRVAAVGVLVQAEHAARAAVPNTLAQAERVDAGEGETLGYSDGSPGQVFHLRRLPALKLGRGEGLDVVDPDTNEWVPWTLRQSFAGSGPEDRHYCFDPVAGEVSLGPAIRERDNWIQLGAIPPEGAAVRMRYRWGGGASGNVDAGTLTVLRRPVPGIASVTNPAPAIGGVDPESLAQARRSAPVELRTRSRAVTAEDYTALAREASRGVARARCPVPEQGRPVVVHILPTAARPARRIPVAELQPADGLLAKVARYLDKRRVLGTSLEVAPIALRGVTAVVEVQPEPEADPKDVERLVGEALYRYINPYVGGSVTGEGDGWKFGRPLTVGEVRIAIRAVPGVREVPILRLYATDLATGAPDGHPVDGRLEIGPDELVASAEHLVRVLELEGR